MSDDEVIKGLQAGGNLATAALTALAKGETARHMLRFFQHQGVAGEDVLDILQETLIRIHRYAADFRAEGTAKSWFWQVARSCLAEHWRKHSRGSATDQGAEAEELARLTAVRGGGVEVIENGVKVTRIPYAGKPIDTSSTNRTPWVGTVDEEQWAELEETVAGPDCAIARQTAAECVALGFETFANQDPERARVLGMQMDGHPIAEIAECIGRTVAATREYLSQCRKKITPFIMHCRELQEA
jgi:RNA polymerase sigma factor (sigma-70 family)